jgi:hypothetical protein
MKDKWKYSKEHIQVALGNHTTQCHLLFAISMYWKMSIKDMLNCTYNWTNGISYGTTLYYVILCLLSKNCYKNIPHDRQSLWEEKCDVAHAIFHWH